MILRIGGNSKGGNMKKEEALKIYNALFKYLAKHRKKRAVRFGSKPEG